MTKEEFLQAIEQMTVKDLAELVSAIEERFGVSAQVVLRFIFSHSNQ